MLVKFGTGTKDVPLSEVTAANYIVPKGEENTYHVLQDIPRYDQRTGKKLSIARIQKYGLKEFKDISRILRQQGYELTILYDPTDYIKRQQEAEEERKALTETKRRELEAKKREAEKAALKAEILAELKEQGIIPSETKKAAMDEKKGTQQKKK